MSQQKLDTWELIKLMFRKEFSRIKEKYTRILSDFAIRILLIFVKPAVKITSRFLPWILPVARFYGRLSSTKKIFVSISIVLFLFFIIVPKNTFIYEYVYRVLTLPGTALWAWWHSNLSTYAIVSKLVNTYLAERGFTLYNSFAW